MISRWANTQAAVETVCPRCEAPTGESCQTPKGRRVDIHGERTAAYRKAIGAEEFNKRHRITVVKGWPQ